MAASRCLLAGLCPRAGAPETATTAVRGVPSRDVETNADIRGPDVVCPGVWLPGDRRPEHAGLRAAPRSDGGTGAATAATTATATAASRAHGRAHHAHAAASAAPSPAATSSSVHDGTADAGSRACAHAPRYDGMAQA